MIAVIAKYPDCENDRDGMIQRVAAIDALMKNCQKIYLDISFRRHVIATVKRKENIEIYRLNAFVHFFRIFFLLRQCSCIYVHSAYNALKIFPFLYIFNVIFDAHGVVPEELKQCGKNLASWIFAIAEGVAVRRADVLICVTHRMRQHFMNKYGRAENDKDIVLPILPNLEHVTNSREDVLRSPRNRFGVIYAGGQQIWQNVDKMIDAAMKKSDFQYTFLTGDVSELNLKISSKGLRDCECRTVAPPEVKDYYLKNTYGFILREDMLVNDVACPTKLIEYIYWGVLPIVLNANIGDFNRSSLHSVSLADFLSGVLPAMEDRQWMLERNRDLAESMIASAERSRIALVHKFGAW